VAQPTLPSVVAAEALLKNQPGAVGKLLWSLAQRAAIIAPALYLAGERKRVVRYTLVATLAIEAVVLWEVRRQLGVRRG
jgi:hypothetical protein